MNIKFDNFESKFSCDNMLNHSYRLDFLDIDSAENVQNSDIFDQFANCTYQNYDNLFDKAQNLWQKEDYLDYKPMNTLLCESTPNSNARNGSDNLISESSTSLVLEKCELYHNVYPQLNDGECMKNKLAMNPVHSDMCIKDLAMINSPSCEATAGYFSSGNFVNGPICNEEDTPQRQLMFDDFTMRNSQRWNQKDDIEMFKIYKMKCEEHNIEPHKLWTSKIINEDLLNIIYELIGVFMWKGSTNRFVKRIQQLGKNQKLSVRQTKRLKSLCRKQRKQNGEIDFSQILEKFPGKSIESLKMAYAS